MTIVKAPFRVGQTLIGPLFNEPMQVETVAPAGSGSWALGLVGAQSERFRRVTMAEADIPSITILDTDIAFNGDGNRLRLGIQAYSLGIAYEFDPYFGLSISRVDPLPHQLEAVYDHLLKLARVRFLLADDAGAGKTIMAGLLIKELKLRGFHFEKAKPDQGRKTLQSRLMDLAQTAADTAVRYLAAQTIFLKPAGEKSTAAQREVELNHEDWVFNVKNHARMKPLSLPPIAYASEPLTEQDVIGLFNQLCAIGLFPGIKVFATSTQRTFDCYVQFERDGDLGCLRYRSVDDNPLGLSSHVFGSEEEKFQTRGLTLEFKSNLEKLIGDLESESSAKTFSRVDILVCWNAGEEKHRRYDLVLIDESNLDERLYPGVTHVLRKDGEASHAIQVIMLEQVVKQIQAGHIRLT